MEVMLEIYRTLNALEMEWKEKRFLGGLGGKRTNHERTMIEREPKMDGPSAPMGVGRGGEAGGGKGVAGASGDFDEKVASSIYYVEARARVDNVVVSGLYGGVCTMLKKVDY